MKYIGFGGIGHYKIALKSDYNVTPEMMKAGEKELRKRWGTGYRGGRWWGDTLAAVYQAMQRARRD